MNMNKLGVLLALCAVPFLPTCSCAGMNHHVYPQSDRLNDSLPISEGRDYEHPRTGTNFPLDAAGFERTRLVRYDRQANDLAIGYEHGESSDKISVTFYLYPIPHDQSRFGQHDAAPDHWRDLRVSELTRAFDGLVRANYGSSIDEIGDSDLAPNLSGRYGRASSPRQSPVGDRSISSEVHVFTLDEIWFFKVRASYYPELYDLAQQRMKELIAEINLPGSK